MNQSNSPDRVLEDMKRLVSDCHCETIEKLSLETALENDLGMTGDDADEFLEEFTEHFDVDLSQFDFSKHFGSECFAVWAWPYYMIMWFARHVASPEYHTKLGGREPVTIRDLVETVLAGSWHNRHKPMSSRSTNNVQ